MAAGLLLRANSWTASDRSGLKVLMAHLAVVVPAGVHARDRPGDACMVRGSAAEQQPGDIGQCQSQRPQ